MYVVQSVDSGSTDNGIVVIIVHVLFLPSFPLCVQELAEVTAAELSPPPPQDSSTDILPEGTLGEMNALGQTIKIWWV